MFRLVQFLILFLLAVDLVSLAAVSRVLFLVVVLLVLLGVGVALVVPPDLSGHTG